MKKLRRTFLASALLGSLALVSHGQAFAGQSVNTSALNPPPPPVYSCMATGTETICRAVVNETYGPVDTATQGPPLVCGIGASAFDIWDTGIHTQDKTRVYDQNGNLVRRVIHDHYSFGQWSNPLTGAFVRYTQNTVVTDVYAVPGDLSSATETQTGESVFTAPHFGQVFVDTGRTVTASDGTLLFESGHNDFGAYFAGDTAVLQKLCAALGAQ